MSRKTFADFLSERTPDFDHAILESIRPTDAWIGKVKAVGSWNPKDYTGKWTFKMDGFPRKRREVEPLVSAIRKARREEAKKRKNLTVADRKA